MAKYDFGGWATRNDLLCADGRTIRKDAFLDNDGQTVPLVWNHQHGEVGNVLGHALLENRDDGVYAYATFNDSEAGKNAKELVKHGDITSLSIYANKLKETKNREVLHGVIRELSLVLAGANSGAFIDTVMAHGEDSEDGIIASYDENLTIYHSDEEDPKDKPKEKSEDKSKDKTEEKTVQDIIDSMTEEQQKVAWLLIGNALNGENAQEEEAEIEHSDESGNASEDEGNKTVEDVINSMTEEQQKALEFVIQKALESSSEDSEDESDDKLEHNDEDIEGGNYMKHNVFDKETEQAGGVLTHSDQEAILALAKSSGVGSFKTAMEMYVAENDHLAHGIDEIETLFPEYKDTKPGAPELITRDQGWISTVISGTHKSPISRIRTRQADIRATDIRGRGYVKGNKKQNIANAKLVKRTTDPQTVYVKDFLQRDDIIDITDFDVVDYQYGIMRMSLNEELAMAIMVGDGRDEGDDDKIDESHIRPIWTDDELYTIHADVDIDAAKAELQGSGTDVSFGENYIYAEAIITAALYAREKYKGSGSLTFYCTPHLLNVMLLARDMNGRRIYDSKTDLAAALNVTSIQTAEQFEGKTRTTDDSKTKELLGLFVNLADYQLGSTKGGEITKFDDFDIQFNQYQYLLETRVSGALTRVYSAIALEKDVTTESVAG